MDNAEVLKSLQENDDQPKTDEQNDGTLTKYVVFLIENTYYAIIADQVREISFDNELYYVPFMPPYIRGYANRHGQPFTVYDVRMLFEQTPLESSTLLILKIPGDQLALLITDIDEIIKLPSSESHPLASSDDSARYFSHSITVKNREIFVLNVGTLLERLERDIEHV
jgi:chemotaxis signal transduction protein